MVNGGRRPEPRSALTDVADRSTSRLSGRAKVLEALSRLGPLSRTEVARHACLAPSTVTGLVSALVDERVITESDHALATHGPGRPATLLAIRRSVGVVVGLDFGKRHLAVAVYDLAHERVAEDHTGLPPDLPAHEQIARARGSADALLAGAGLGWDDVLAVTAGIPGPVHRTSGELGEATILPGWIGTAARDALSAAFDHPVHVENDANLGALAEWMWGAARGVDHVVYVKLSTGIGSGLVINGEPFTGAGGTAGEVGHVAIRTDGPPCRCGRRGCLESVTGSGLVVDEVRAAHRGVRTVRDVLRLAADHDPVAVAALERCGRAVGTALGTVCNVLNPRLIVLGGELASAGDMLLVPLRTELRARSLRSVGDDVEVRVGQLGRSAELLGSVAMALRDASGSVLERLS